MLSTASVFDRERERELRTVNLVSQGTPEASQDADGICRTILPLISCGRFKLRNEYDAAHNTRMYGTNSRTTHSTYVHDFEHHDDDDDDDNDDDNNVRREIRSDASARGQRARLYP